MLKITTEYMVPQPAAPATPAGPDAPMVISMDIDLDINRAVFMTQIGSQPLRATRYNRDECLALGQFFTLAAGALVGG